MTAARLNMRYVSKAFLVKSYQEDSIGFQYRALRRLGENETGLKSGKKKETWNVSENARLKRVASWQELRFLILGFNLIG